MKLLDLFTEDNLPVNEGWKDIVRAGAIGTALAIGVPKIANYIDPTIATSQNGPSVGAVPEPNPQHEHPGPGFRMIKPITNHPNELILLREALKNGINGYQLAQLMAQARHETHDFGSLVERGSKEYFNRYDPVHNPKLARILGNTQAGDGERFKGRGFLHVTGRYWYRIIGDAIGVDLIARPELMERPDIAAKSSIWFWKNRVMKRDIDPRDTRAVTRVVHPGLRALPKRAHYYQDYISTSSPQ